MPVLDGFSLHLRDAIQHMPHVACQAAGQDEGDGPAVEESGEGESLFLTTPHLSGLLFAMAVLQWEP